MQEQPDRTSCHWIQLYGDFLYGTGSRRYTNFSDLYAVLNPFLVSESILICFASYLFTEGMKTGTFKSYLVAVRHTQISLRLEDPDMPLVKYVI